MADTPPASHLDAPPDERLWLSDLGFERYGQTLTEAAKPGWLEEEVASVYKGTALAARVTEVLDGALGPDQARLHLVLLARAIERLKTAALADVAKARLPRETLKRWRGEKGRWARLPLALELYLVDPDTLLDVVVCDRWHARRRCVLRVHGRVPTLKTPLGLDQVDAAARSALAVWRKRRSSHATVSLLRVFTRKPGEFLVAFRRQARLDSLRDENDDLLTGYREEPVILRLCDGAHRVDVTANRLEDAVDLAGDLGSAILGKQVEYRKRRDKVREEDLDAFLARLCNPAADDLQLVEIKAEMPGEPNRPVKAILGNGSNRIEATVHREGERTAYARDWRAVHHAKVYFEGYRFTVHFPPPDSELVLTYSDLDRDTNVSEEFEQVIEKLRDEFGADIKITPRSKDPSGASPRRKEKGRPRSLDLRHWTRLLGPVLDDPMAWEERELIKLRDKGLLSWRTAWYFRCGDPGIDRRKAGVSDQTLDCVGVIEWSATEDPDPYAELMDVEQSCGQCNETWRVFAYRPPLHQRWYVDLDQDAVFAEVLKKLQPRLKDAEIEAEGVASGMLGGRRTYVVYLGLTTASAAAATVGSHPTMWVAPTASALLGVGPSAMALPELFTGKAAVKRLLDSAAPSTPAATAAPAPGPSPSRRPARRQTTKPAKPTSPASRPPKFATIALVEGRVLFYVYASEADREDGGLPSNVFEVAKPHAVGVKLLLALLAEAQRHSPGDDSFRKVEDLTRLDDDIHAQVDAQVFYKWVKRTRKSLDDIAVGLGRLVIEGDDPEGARASRAHGYRLGSQVPVSGFQFDSVVQDWKSHGKNRGKTDA